MTLDHPLLALALLAALLAAQLLLARRSRAEGGAARRASAFGVRALLVTLLVLALAGLQGRRERPEVAVAFVVDSSDSVRGAAQDEAARVLDEAARHAGRGDRRAVVQFGRDALIEEGLTDDLRPVALASRPRPDGSDLAGALRLAEALLPPDGRRRIVLLTDGESDGEDPAAAIRALAEGGCDVLLAPLSATRGAETLVEEVSAPERVHEGEPFEVRVALRASAGASGTLTVTDNGALLAQQEVALPAGAPVVLRCVGRHAQAGTHLYRAHLDASPDSLPQNDAAEALVRVEGQPSVLLVDPRADEVRAFAALLDAAGLAVSVRGPGALPATLAEAARHDAIVLSNVESLDLATRQMQVLRAFVRETGGGLLMTGGPDSFGPGGWYQTPVEEALPVDMDVRNEKYFPSLTLVTVLDKSGSMSGSDGASKMDLAKEAAALAVELLHPDDRAGVVAFDSAAKWVVPVAKVSDRRAVAQRIGTIRAGGGTDIYPALEMAGEAVVDQPTVLKHLILLTDGQSPPRDYRKLIEGLVDKRVTVSTVAVGADADLFTLQRFAEWGRGRYYYTDDPASIPRIFTKEAFTTARSFVVEEQFVPRVAHAHPVLRGAEGLPSLGGYVATSAKPAAETALVSHRDDPVLALWRFGLGRSAALTTDLGARWAPDWIASPSGRTLLAQLVRHLAGRADSSRLRTTLERRDGRVAVTVEARDDDGAHLNFADLRASVVGPDLRTHEVALRQVAPGRYQGQADGGDPGPWFAGVVQRQGERVVRQTSVATVFPYSDEYRTLAEGAAIERLSAASGARVAATPAEAFARTGPPALALRPLWRELLALAAVVLLVDVALRRVMLPAGWLETAIAWISARLPRRRGVATGEAPPALARLRGAKAAVRATGAPVGTSAGAGGSPPGAHAASTAGTPAATLAGAAGSAPGPHAASTAGAPATTVAGAGGGAPGPLAASTAGAPAEAPDFAGRLLAAKRRARKDPS